MFSKKKRVVNKSLLETIRRLPCMGCVTRENYYEAIEAIHDGTMKLSHPHHLISRGAGGDDIPQNLAPLCPKHHTEIHMIGIKEMALKYKTFRVWLISAGWIYHKTRDKWVFGEHGN